LAAKQDFMTVDEQKATYNFLNVVPMWNKLNANGSEWFKLEEQTRKDAQKENLRVTIGTLGVMTLKDKEIYLDHDNKRLPVPRYLYKIVTNQTESKVHVFFHNTFVIEADARKEMNEIFGDKVTHLNDKPETGYTLTMSYADFREKVNEYFKGYELPENIDKPTAPAAASAT
jgi:DNA/RNA endonuclease G (NUC1)